MYKLQILPFKKHRVKKYTLYGFNYLMVKNTQMQYVLSKDRTMVFPGETQYMGWSVRGTPEEPDLFLVLVSRLWSLHENSPHEPFSYICDTSLKCLPESSSSYWGSNISQAFS